MACSSRFELSWGFWFLWGVLGLTQVRFVGDEKRVCEIYLCCCVVVVVVVKRETDGDL